MSAYEDCKEAANKFILNTVTNLVASIKVECYEAAKSGLFYQNITLTNEVIDNEAIVSLLFLTLTEQEKLKVVYVGDVKSEIRVSWNH